MSLIGASFHKTMSTAGSQSAMASSRSASERQSMTMASSQRATASRQSDVSISVQDYSLERPRGSTPRVQSSFWAVLSDMRGSLWLVGGLVHTWEAFFGCAIAIASTLLCYFFEFQNDTSAVSTILGVVIVFPITALIGFAFSRREKALEAFSRLLGNLEALLGAACTWQKFQDGTWRPVHESNCRGTSATAEPLPMHPTHCLICAQVAARDRRRRCRAGAGCLHAYSGEGVAVLCDAARPPHALRAFVVSL